MQVLPHCNNPSVISVQFKFFADIKANIETKELKYCLHTSTNEKYFVFLTKSSRRKIQDYERNIGGIYS